MQNNNMTEEQFKDKELFFVYGTLRNGYGNNRLLEDEEFIGEAITANKYTMMASGIPYVFKMPETSFIEGELWQVKKESIPNIDSLEGHPNWYRRELIKVNIGKQQFDAWIYFMQGKANINHPQQTLIENGDFTSYRERG